MPTLTPSTLALIQDRREAGSTQSAIARRIGISASSLSLLLRGLYPARDLSAMERRIIATLGPIHCPYLGTVIESCDCTKLRNHPMPTSDPGQLRHWHACQICQTGQASAKT